MADFRDLLDGTTLSYSSGLGRVHPDVMTSISQKARGAGTFHMLDNGAVGDGSTDDTAAWLATCTAANAEGANVGIPPSTLITEGFTFDQSTFSEQKAVFVSGAGEGTSTILWEPEDPDDTFVRFYKSGDAYVGGGVRNLTLWCESGIASGVGIHITDAYRTSIENVWVRNFRATGGIGLKIDDAGISPQHTHLMNVHLQECDTGYDINGVNECRAYHLNVNQCLTTPGVFRAGTLLWVGGLVQSLGSLEFRPDHQAAINFTQIGIYYESNDFVPHIKGYTPSTGGGPGSFAGAVTIHFATVAGGNYSSWAVFEPGYAIDLKQVGQTFALPLLTADYCTVKGHDLYPDPARYVLDSFTAAHASWDNPGNVAIGIGHPDHPDFGSGSLTLGAPPRLFVCSNSTRDTLTPQTGWVILNSSTNTVQWWNGSTWV